MISFSIPPRRWSALFVLLTLPFLPAIQAQCPEFTSSGLSSPDCFNGSTPCDVCPGDIIQLTAGGTNLPDGGCVNWYFSNNPSFDPYAGQGTFMGCGNISTPPPPPCSNCPEILAIWIDACGSEQANEFMIISSGSGFNVNNLGVDFDASNNVNSSNNDDINTNGGSCNWQTPTGAILSAMQSAPSCNGSNIIAAGPGTTIPPGVIVIIWTSASATTTYNFEEYCAAGQPIYVMQNSCPRTIGAFSNSTSTGTRTTTLKLNNCNCAHSFTHDTDDPALSGDGDYAYYNNGNIEYGNSGCGNPTPPYLEPLPVDYPPSTVTPVNYTIPSSLCNQGPFTVLGIISPQAPGCPPILTDAFTFNVLCPEASATFSGTPCTGNSITLQAGGGTGYQWSGPAGFSSSEQNPVLGPLSGANAGTYSVTVSNAAGCTATAEVQLTVFPAVSISVSPQNPSICEGQSVLLTATAQGGGGGYTFQWTTPGGGSDNGPGILVNTGGSYSVTVTDSNGCTAETGGTVSIQPGPAVSIEPNPAGFCTGGEVELSATITGGAGGNQYLWQDPAGNPFSTPTLLVTSPGTYTLLVTDQAGCTGTAQVQVTENPLPAVSLSADPPAICPGASVLLTAAGSGGTGSYAYTWETPTGPNSGNPLQAGAAGTYFVTLTDAAGCSATDSLVLATGSDLTITFNPNPASFCPGGSVVLSAQVQGGQGGELTYLWMTPAGPASGNPLNTALPGLYTVEVSEANGCSGSASIEVTENSQLSISFAQDSVAICAGGEALLSGVANGGDGNYSYTWIYPGGPSSGDTLLVNQAGTYILQATDGNNCMGTDSVIVWIAPGLDIRIQPGQPALCPGASTTLTLDPLPQSGWTIQWTTPGGSASGHPLTGATAGTYTVLVAYGAGCTSSDTLVIDPLPVPQITLSPASPVICPGSGTTLSVTLLQGGPLQSYAWTTPSGPASGMAILATLAGSYSVTVTNDQGCTASAATTVTLSAGIPVSFSSPTITICSGASIALSPQIGGGSAPYQYLWSGPGGSSTADTLITGIAGIYNVTVTESGGCSGTATVTVLTGSNLSVSIQPASPGFCPGGQVLLSAQANGGQAPFLYVWTGPSQTGSEATLPATEAGLYGVTLTDASGCSGEASTLVTAWPAPTLSITPPGAQLCPGQTVSLNAAASGTPPPYVYAWSGPGGPISGATYPQGGAGNYTVTVTDNRGCTAAASASVQEIAALTPAILPAQPSLCTGGTASVLANVPGGTPPYTYTWYGPGGSILNGNPGLLNQTGLWTLEVSDATGCSGSLSFQVQPGTALQVSISTSLTTTCGDLPYTAAAVPLSGTPPFTYAWNTPQGPATDSLLNLQGAGQLQLTVTDQQGCQGSVSATIAEGTLPLALLALEERCPGAGDGELVLSGILPSSLPLQVSLNNGAAQIVNSLPLAFTGLSAGFYTVAISDANGCTASASAEIGLLFQPTLVFQPAEWTIFRGSSVTLAPQASFSPSQYSWTPPTGLSCTTCLQPLASPDNTTLYTLTATDEEGCQASATVRVVVVGNTRVYIPTAFSPNFDGINDHFFVYAADEGVRIETMQIYDRWGNALFEARDIPVNEAQFGWDGHFRGQRMQPGVYVYTIGLRFPEGGYRLYRGDLTLME